MILVIDKNSYYKDYIRRRKKYLEEEVIEAKELIERLKYLEELRESIITRRLILGITQKTLAEKIGTRQSAISRFENGRIEPKLIFIRKITEVLGLKLKISAD